MTRRRQSAHELDAWTRPAAPADVAAKIDLFTPAPAVPNRPTSIEAAERIAGAATSIRWMVYGAIAAAGAYGATDDEIQRALGCHPNTETARRGELVDRGVVVDSGRVRPTAAGREAIVWVVDASRPVEIGRRAPGRPAVAGRARKRGGDLAAELAGLRAQLADVEAWLMAAAADGGPMDLGALAAILDRGKE